MTRKTSCYGPAPDIRGTVNSYWLQQKKIRESSRKRQAPRRKRQATSGKLKKPLDLWTPVG